MYQTMSVSSSAFADLQPPTDFSSSNVSTYSIFVDCLKFRTSSHIITGFTVINTLLVFPLSIIILYLGFQQWRQRCSTSTAAMTSQSDLFTYNMVAMVLIEILASILYSIGGYKTIPELAAFASVLFFNTWAVKLQFHTLTCVERYLAVVHPVTYLGHKTKNGKRIRNINICCIWLLLFVWFGLKDVTSELMNLTMAFSLSFLAFIVVCFCSISVLCALRRPGPGEPGRDGGCVNQTKRRAFLTILTITGTLLLSLGLALVCYVLYLSLVSEKDRCMIIASVPWLCLPCTGVLPLLYLHRARKLPR